DAAAPGLPVRPARDVPARARGARPRPRSRPRPPRDHDRRDRGPHEHLQLHRAAAGIAAGPAMTTPFDPARDDVQALGRAVADWIAAHFEALQEMPVIPDTTPEKTFALFDEPVPEHGGTWPDLLERFRRDVVPNSLHLPSPRYFGLMNPTPLPVAVFAEALAAALNQNVGAWHHSPAGTAIERQVIRWLCDLAGYPKTSFGSLTSGGSLANTTGLKIALAAKIPESTRGGVWGLSRRPVLYASQ